MVPMNLLRGKSAADYVNTGEWSKKAIKEAKKFCKVNVAASARGRELHLRARAVRAGSSTRTPPTCTSARTRPSAASSSTGCRTPARCRWSPTCRRTSCRARSTSSKYGLIYAGAQKNIGPAGLTIVIVRDDLIGHAPTGTPIDARLQGRRPTTTRCPTRPPTYAIYIAGLVFKWLKRAGRPRGDGAAGTSPRPGCSTTTSATRRFFRSPVREGGPLAHERAVHAARRGARRGVPQGRARSAGMVQLKGHRSVGGMRASIYNAMPIEGVKRAGRVHAGVRARAMAERYRASCDRSNQISPVGLKRFPAGALRGGQGIGAARCDPGALRTTCTRCEIARFGEGDRARRRRHQQHPGARR